MEGNRDGKKRTEEKVANSMSLIKTFLFAVTTTAAAAAAATAAAAVNCVFRGYCNSFSASFCVGVHLSNVVFLVT